MLLQDRLFFCAPTRLLAGPGVRAELAPLLAKMGFQRGLIVTDSFFSQHTSLVNELSAQLKEQGIAVTVCDMGAPDPTTWLCDDATLSIRSDSNSDEIDHVIALGGGSNIDLAKALCVALKIEGSVETCVNKLLPAEPLPLIAIPTTAGTGSEITPGAILIKPDSATKVAVMDNSLRPVVAVVDPELTLTCPPRVTADAGLDALTHAIESYLTIDSADYDRGGNADPGYSGRSSLTNMFAVEAIRLCAENLSTAYHNGQDLNARTAMAYSSVYAALSYGSAGLNAVHGLAYALAGLTHASHGSTNAVLLPYVMQALLPVRRTELAQIARLFGASGNEEAELAAQAPVLVHKLVCELGIPGNLKAFGVSLDQLSGLVRDGLAVTRLTQAFPIQPAEPIYGQIIENAYYGTLT